MPDKEHKYNCQRCPYPRYKIPEHIFCDVCIRKIMDNHKTEMEIHQGTRSAQSPHPDK